MALADAPPYDLDRFVTVPLLDGCTCDARIIRLSPGQASPPHTHEPSELMLFVADGDAVLAPRVAVPASLTGPRCG